MKLPKSIIIGIVMMILLGLARGIGGIILLLQGTNTLSNITASEITIRMLAIGLIVIGILEIISAIGILRLKRFFWLSGIAVSVVFVLDGAVNGYFLFGKPGDVGTFVNIIVAAVIIICLFTGRKAFTVTSASNGNQLN